MSEVNEANGLQSHQPPPADTDVGWSRCSDLGIGQVRRM